MMAMLSDRNLTERYLLFGDRYTVFGCREGLGRGSDDRGQNSQADKRGEISFHVVSCVLLTSFCVSLDRLVNGLSYQ